MDLHWQSGITGGNPIKSCYIAGASSTIDIAADTWAQGGGTIGTSLSINGPVNQHGPSDAGYQHRLDVNIKSTKPIGQESAPLAIPSLKAGCNIPWDATDFEDTISTITFNAGVTIGDSTPAAGRGLFCKGFKFKFSNESAQNTRIQEGRLRGLSIIDAGDLPAGKFKMMPAAEYYGGGVVISLQEDQRKVKVLPPRDANLRINPFPAVPATR